MTLPILDRLVVWWNERRAGEFSIDKGDAMHFAYAPEWLDDKTVSPLSYAMAESSVTRVQPFNPLIAAQETSSPLRRP